jgi:endonuclease-3
MNKKERYEHVLTYFEKHVPEAETELHYTNSFELLIAVILSAQCTDKRINLVTPKLFAAFPHPEILANASVEEVFGYIRSVSYPNNKAKHLVGMGKMLMEKFNAEVPSTVEELQQLPGVGRKTANVIVSVIHHAPAMAVDTHVFRVSARLGLTTNAKTPLAAEKQLIKFIPSDKVHIAHHWLILHGRYTCLASSPKCEICPISMYCKYYSKNY